MTRRIFDVDEWITVIEILRDFVRSDDEGSVTFKLRRSGGKIELVVWDRVQGEPSDGLPYDLPKSL